METKGSTRRDHRKTATRAGLTYVTDGFAGITRKRAGSGWAFFAPNGARIRDQDKRRRLKALAIPPAYIKTSYHKERRLPPEGS